MPRSGADDLGASLKIKNGSIRVRPHPERLEKAHVVLKRVVLSSPSDEEVKEGNNGRRVYFGLYATKAFTAKPGTELLLGLEGGVFDGRGILVEGVEDEEDEEEEGSGNESGESTYLPPRLRMTNPALTPQSLPIPEQVQLAKDSKDAEAQTDDPILSPSPELVSCSMQSEPERQSTCPISTQTDRAQLHTTPQSHCSVQTSPTVHSTTSTQTLVTSFTPRNEVGVQRECHRPLDQQLFRPPLRCPLQNSSFYPAWLEARKAEGKSEEPDQVSNKTKKSNARKKEQRRVKRRLHKESKRQEEEGVDMDISDSEGEEKSVQTDPVTILLDASQPTASVQSPKSSQHVEPSPRSALPNDFPAALSSTPKATASSAATFPPLISTSTSHVHESPNPSFFPLPLPIPAKETIQADTMAPAKKKTNRGKKRKKPTKEEDEAEGMQEVEQTKRMKLDDGSASPGPARTWTMTFVDVIPPAPSTQPPPLPAEPPPPPSIPPHVALSMFNGAMSATMAMKHPLPARPAFPFPPLPVPPFFWLREEVFLPHAHSHNRKK